MNRMHFLAVAPVHVLRIAETDIFELRSTEGVASLWVTDLVALRVTAKWETKWWCQISALMWEAFKRDAKKTKQQLLFNTNGPFNPHQILAEGWQCSTSPHCRAPGNQWAWTMTQHHLVNRQLSQYSSMMTMHYAHLTSELTHTVLWILRHLLKVFVQCLGWTPKQPGDGSRLSLNCKSDALFTF